MSGVKASRLPGGRTARGRSSARAASSRTAATAARRPRRSPGRPVSPSRSSTATSTSKRDLYIACLEESGSACASSGKKPLRRSPTPASGSAPWAALSSSRLRIELMSNLWVQALAEASEDDEIRAYLHSHLTEVHDFVVDVIRVSRPPHGHPRRSGRRRRGVDLHLPRFAVDGRPLPRRARGGPVARHHRLACRWLAGKDITEDERKSWKDLAAR